MEKKSKAEKLKLRGINQTILISSYNSGAGTGPNDCMTEEVYQRLNAQGALDTTVYVCGIGWMTPDVTISVADQVSVPVVVPAAVVVLASIGEADTGEVEIGEVVAGGLVVELVVEELAVEELAVMVRNLEVETNPFPRFNRINGQK